MARSDQATSQPPPTFPPVGTTTTIEKDMVMDISETIVRDSVVEVLDAKTSAWKSPVKNQVSLGVEGLTLEVVAKYWERSYGLISVKDAQGEVVAHAKYGFGEYTEAELAAKVLPVVNAALRACSDGRRRHGIEIAIVAAEAWQECRMILTGGSTTNKLRYLLAYLLAAGTPASQLTRLCEAGFTRPSDWSRPVYECPAPERAADEVKRAGSGQYDRDDLGYVPRWRESSMDQETQAYLKVVAGECTAVGELRRAIPVHTTPWTIQDLLAAPAA